MVYPLFCINSNTLSPLSDNDIMKSSLGIQDCIRRRNELSLNSSQSTRKSLEAIRSGKAALNEPRKKLYQRVPERGQSATFSKGTIKPKDLAYLSAFCGDEFALLRGKKEDVLYHGAKTSCVFKGIVYNALMQGKLKLIAHSHPGEYIPEPSIADRRFLRQIKQYKSVVISARSGIEVVYTGNLFDIIQFQKGAENDVDIF